MSDYHVKPKAGDLAWHKDGLDPRPILRVEGESIFLELLTPGKAYGPFPAWNYRFSKPGRS